MPRTLTESLNRNTQPTYVMIWLANRKRTHDAQGRLAELLKPKARHLLPGHFSNAASMLRYASQLTDSTDALDAVPYLFVEYLEFYHKVRLGRVDPDELDKMNKIALSA